MRKSCCENSNAHIEITDVARGLEVVKVVKPADVLDEATGVSIILKKNQRGSLLNIVKIFQWALWCHTNNHKYSSTVIRQM